MPNNSPWFIPLLCILALLILFLPTEPPANPLPSMASTSPTTLPEATDPTAVSAPPTEAAETFPDLKERLEAAEESAAETTEETAPPTTEAEVPPETQSQDPNMPVLVLPKVETEVCHFYDDAAFIGDSISYSLMVHNRLHFDLGDAQFLVRGSLGIHNTLNGQLTVYYQGNAMTPWDALAACGAKKAFIMLGMNDIGYYGVEDTMVKWEAFLARMEETCPDVELYIISLTPMWRGAQQHLLSNANIDLYNAQLEEMAQARGISFVNIAPYFKDHLNSLAAVYCSDLYVHMNEQGTAAWATLMKAYAEGILP